MFEWLQEFLITHNLSVHEGMQYECDQCEFKSTLKVTLRLVMSNSMFFHAGFFAGCRVLQVFTGFLQVFRV